MKLGKLILFRGWVLAHAAIWIAPVSVLQLIVEIF